MTTALAFDFGTGVTRVADEDGSLLLEEPTLAAVDTAAGRLVAFGDEAGALQARAAGRVAVVRPVLAGKLTDLALAELVVAEVLRRIGISRLERARVMVCSHIGSTQVQQRALERALRRGGARDTHFVEIPVAGAIGARVEIGEPRGAMVVDIGAGTTDIGVIALGGLVTSAGLECGGSDFDEAVRRYLSRERGLLVDLRTAEALRRTCGALAVDCRGVIEVTGRDARSGRVRRELIERSELRRPLVQAIAPILNAAIACITAAPPDVANDLVVDGLFLLGGPARMDGLPERLASAAGVPVHMPEETDRLVVRGAAHCLRDRVGIPTAATPARR